MHEPLTHEPRHLIDRNPAARAAAMQHLVDQILGSLDDAGIPYCILRNRDAIPHGLLGWTDIDLVVPDTVSIKHLARIFAHLRPAQIVRIRDGRMAFFFPMDDLFLAVDIFNGDVKWRGVSFADHRDILEHRVNDNGIMVASPMHQAIVVWFSKLLWMDSFPARYEQMIGDAIRAQPTDIRTRLADAFGDELADELVQLAFAGRLAESANMIPRCKQALMQRASRRRPFRTLPTRVGQLRSAIGNRLRPTGLKVVVLGPDGSGKTSICSRLINAPSRNLPVKHVLYEHLYHRVLPPFSTIEARIRRRPVKVRVESLNPHATTPHLPITAMIKFSYYTVDQWVSELLWARKQLSYGDVIIYDRQLLELPIDPVRYRYAGPRRFARLLARLSPKPDLMLILDVDPAIAQSRKQEVPFEETARQREAYRQLAARTPHARIIDASQPLDAVIADVRYAIADTISRRTGKRYGFHGNNEATPQAASVEPVRISEGAAQ